MSIAAPYPDAITDDSTLDALLSLPAPAVVDLMRRMEGDLIVLGVAGKMGVTLALQAAAAVRESGVARRVIGVARFSDPAAREQLEAGGVETIACDLLDRAAVAALPRCRNVIYMAGRKFGTDGNEHLTWAMNVLVPGNVCEHFTDSRIVAFSTGCVYPLLDASTGGADESVRPAPIGEYAQSCLGRERAFEFYSATKGIPVNLFRLNYAIDLRYGVLHDLAQKILADEVVDLSVGHFNAIWQGDANAQAILALEHCSSPATPLNCTGPETMTVRQAALDLGALLGHEVHFSGTPGVGYLSNANLANRLFGYPRVALSTLLRWQAGWLKAGGRSLGKPTHFEVSDGKY